MEEKYQKRIVDAKIQRMLKGIGAVVIEGVKGSGKTTTALQFSKSVLFLSDPKRVAQNLSLADIRPDILLEGDTPRLIDEWQLAPKLWDTIRFEVDKRNKEGQFILTGSSTPADMSQVYHSGVGRFARLVMRPMSLYESGESNGNVSLQDLFANKDIKGINKLELEDIAYLCCRGGWPRSTLLEKDIALDEAFYYYDAIVKDDVSKVDNVERNPERIKNLLRSYARNVGTGATNETIKSDILKNDSASLDTDTVLSYINALKKMFVIEESLAWNPSLRSKVAIRTSNTRYFVDPSIAIATLGLGSKDLINDLNTFNFIFENLCIRDLRIYAESLNGSLYHYKDAADLECDAVVHLRGGDYGLIEIKLGGDKLINEGVNNLLKLKDKIDTNKMKNPSFLMVLTGTGDYAYQRKDKVYIVPIGCLKN